VKKNCLNLLEKGSCKSEIWEILRELFPKYSVFFHSWIEKHPNKLYGKQMAECVIELFGGCWVLLNILFKIQKQRTAQSSPKYSIRFE
jgi:hypothetical protein